MDGPGVQLPFADIKLHTSCHWIPVIGHPHDREPIT